MTMLLAAAAVFLGIHFVISGTRMRDTIVSAIGERPYLGLFSLASAGTIAWLVIAYNHSQAGPDNRLLYDLGHVRDIGIPVVLVAFLIGVPGLLTPNPTSVMQENVATKADAVRGILRITRHRFLWGVALWSGFHLLANGDEASVVFFGTFFILSLLGTLAIDAKRKRKMGETWNAFASRTSNLPFGAVFSRRNTVKIPELLDWRMGAALLVFLAVLFAHSRLFGVSPFPGAPIPV